MKSILVVLALLLPSFGALACSCVSGTGSEKQQIAAAYRQDALVFVGRVTGVETIVTTDTVQVADTGPMEQRIRLIRHESLRYTFAVLQRFKRPLNESRVQVFTESQSASCGREFKVGAKYLVYAFQVSETGSLTGGPPVPVTPYFATSSCNRGQRLKHVSRTELRQLKKLAQSG
ncbi:hypothetical protein [Hymenobacter glacieicola]|uniref:Tissue inhibitor of metalloproteinase n=1 Tax=Hymenobacter glacieicola TaxID=1562124 RepID=A0ABQ1WJ58_9BACT|nr:hypothetical protein [Hymenobacter glacieicola]GGG30239.1 hypothetical protein GCM10011378_03610 [Hymenobacter glacieicola]